MTKKRPVTNAYQRPPVMDLEGFDDLAELALNMSWAWNHETDRLWREIDPQLWEYTHNPCVILQTVSRDKLQHVLTNPKIREHINTLLATNRREREEPSWFQHTYKKTSLNCVAYFCMEYMLSESLPIYSGGLGNVAGDQLKAANDLGVPVIGIGLLYQQGYFRQIIDKEGAQIAVFPYNDFKQLPTMPVRCNNGEWMRIHLELADLSIWLRVWQVQVGSVKLYLLDSNDAANYPPLREITSELYGGDTLTRFKQELILGIGGWHLLDAMGIQPEVCHLNEGHAAFVILERARDFMKKNGVSFAEALAVTRAGNLFTTHTAVSAGFDRFDPALLEKYLGYYAQEILGISVHDLLALGRQNPNDSSEPFNMAYLAIHGSGAVNGVSQLHARVSQHLFAGLFPRWPIDEVPIQHVTNGVHMPSWESIAADSLLTQICGKGRWSDNIEKVQQLVRGISDEKLWQMRNANRQALVTFARERLALVLKNSGQSKRVEEAKKLFDPNILTLGFARRFATYKRPNMLLHDKERLLRLLSNPERPVQLIMAGKAHPADLPGQALIKEWIQFIRNTNARQHIIFLSDDDMLLTEQLIQGVDVWINTPRRPWEACGTSGMKVLVNGGINLSELDGWWAEAYNAQVGWAIGDGNEHGDDPAWDAKEAEDLYNLLEKEVIPEFYHRDANNIPTVWVERMRESMAQLTPRFCASRAVRDYVTEHYVPAATNYLKRAANQGKVGKQIVEWQHALAQNWGALRFGELKIVTENNQHIFEIPIFCNALNHDYIRIELYANGINTAEPVRIEMKRLSHQTDIGGCYIYGASVPATRNAHDFTVRIIPNFPGVLIPLEMTHILWQR